MSSKQNWVISIPWDSVQWLKRKRNRPRDMQYLEQISKPLCWVKETRLKRQSSRWLIYLTQDKAVSVDDRQRLLNIREVGSTEHHRVLWGDVLFCDPLVVVTQPYTLVKIDKELTLLSQETQVWSPAGMLGGSQLFVTPALEDLMPSSGHCGYLHSCRIHTPMCTCT